MNKFFIELFEYNRRANRLVIASLVENPGKVYTRSVELVSHILNAHQTWNHRILKLASTAGPWQIHPRDELDSLDKNNHADSIHIIEHIAFGEPIRYASFAGNLFEHKLEDLLFQVISHSAYHRGQVAIESRQHGLEPVMTDFIYFKMTDPLPG